MVTKMTMPDMVPGMKRAGAIVTDEGGMACQCSHRQPRAGLSCSGGNQRPPAFEGRHGDHRGWGKGIVYEGIVDQAAQAKAAIPATAGGVFYSKPVTATEIKVNVSEPDRAEAAAATQADGVGLLRIEHMILGMGKTPNWYIRSGKTEEYISELISGIKVVADAFYPRPVWVRTLDAPTDEFRAMEGGEGEPHEHNPCWVGGASGGI